jgi:membrane protease YdiL (CAAX protease family)
VVPGRGGTHRAVVFPTESPRGRLEVGCNEVAGFELSLAAALCVVLYGLVWLTGVGSFTAAGLAPGKEVGLQIPLPATIVLLATVGFLQAAIFALGEEIGWRGFLVPELSQVRALR